MINRVSNVKKGCFAAQIVLKGGITFTMAFKDRMVFIGSMPTLPQTALASKNAIPFMFMTHAFLSKWFWLKKIVSF